MTRTVNILASLRLTVVLLLLLSVLVVWGTLYQAEFGLYAAQERFYRSCVVLIKGMVPFPGTQLVMLFLFLNLLSATLLKFRYRWRHTGSILTHLGLLILLVGGFLIRLHARESRLTLEEGEGANVSVSYYDWEIATWTAASSTMVDRRLSRRVHAVATRGLSAGDRLSLGEAGVTLEVLAYHANARVTGPSGDLRPLPRNKEPTADVPGCLLRVTDAGGESHELRLYGHDRAPTELALNGVETVWSLQRMRRQLPFTLVLHDFKREMHAASSMARSYSSDVTIVTEGMTRDAHIAMNEPLHYGGFTLFQSSYQEIADGRAFSTLAVVENRGRYLPYVGSLVVFVGMLVHFTTVLHRRRVRDE